MRDTVATIGSTPWRRAPRLLLARPTVFLAVAGASFLLVTATSAAPMFVSASGTAALHKQMDERCLASSGATFQATAAPLSVDLAIRQVTGATPGAGMPIATHRVPGPLSASPAAGGEAWPVQLMSRTNALAHVEVLQGTGGASGLWIADTTADRLGVRAGDEVNLHNPPRVVPLTVAGVYRDVASAPLDDYWCAQQTVIAGQSASGDAAAPLALVDLDTFDDILVRLELGGIGPISWVVPPEDPRMTLAAADGLVAAYQNEWLPGIREVLLDRIVDPQTVQPASSSLPFMARRSHAIRTTVAAGVLPVAAAAALAGLGMVAAASSFWYDRRATEVALLAARGVSPAAIGVKAALEALPAALVAAAAGATVAYLAVVTLGPSTFLERAAVVDAAQVAVIAAGAAIVLLGVVPALRARAHDDRRSRIRRIAAFVPWELGLGALTVIAYRRLGEAGAPVAAGDDVTTVDSVGLAFPLVFLGTALVIVARLAAFAVRRTPIDVRWTAGYLALRRLRAHPGAAVTLVVSSALAIGVLSYSSALIGSLQATLDAKARVFVGSDLAVRLGGSDRPPDNVSSPSTAVFRMDGRVGGERVDVLAIDPKTFASAAFWDESFSGRSLADLVAAIDVAGPTASAPVLLVGGGLPSSEPLRIDDSGGTEVVPQVVERLDVFPGMNTGRPTVVLSKVHIDPERSRPVNEMWVKGEPDRSLAEMQDAGVNTVFTRDARTVVDQASFLTVEWTFAFMTALGFASGAITIGGLAIYLDARRRARVLAYAFARRMGMTRGTHRRALFAELSATVALGTVAGVAIAVIGVGLSYARIDPVPSSPPPPLLRLAPVTMAGLAITGLVLSWTGAYLAQRRADADSAAEVLRAGT